MRPDDDDLTMPKCLFCSQRREGQRHVFWGGYHLSTKERRPFLSSTTTIISQYRDMKRVGVFACHACARRIVSRASLLTIVVSALCAVGCGAVAVFFGDPAYFRWGAIAGTVLAGLVAVGYAGMSLYPNLDSWTSDAIIRDKAAPLLKSKGKGDAFFTQREYDLLFTKKPADGHETAQELLEGIEEDDDRPRRKRRERTPIQPAHQDTKLCPFCSGQIPSYAEACPLCKKILA